MMMSLSEAFSTQGSLLGAAVTFVLYGVLPLSIVIYILGTPSRKRALREAARQADAEAHSELVSPDARRHAPSAAEGDSVPAVGKEP